MRSEARRRFPSFQNTTPMEMDGFWGTSLGRRWDIQKTKMGKASHPHIYETMQPPRICVFNLNSCFLNKSSACKSSALLMDDSLSPFLPQQPRGRG